MAEVLHHEESPPFIDEYKYLSSHPDTTVLDVMHFPGKPQQYELRDARLLTLLVERAFLGESPVAIEGLYKLHKAVQKPIDYRRWERGLPPVGVGEFGAMLLTMLKDSTVEYIDNHKTTGTKRESSLLAPNELRVLVAYYGLAGETVPFAEMAEFEGRETLTNEKKRGRGLIVGHLS